ncbi:hypothetical protein D3C84_889230 [compost metagenome]
MAAMSLLMMRMVVLPSLFILSSSRRIWEWVVDSMALVGSSATSSRGWLAMAMAIITFWHMPSDSSWG